MLELADHAELDKPMEGPRGSSGEEDAATKESLAFLFRQIMGCIAEISSQVPPLFETNDDAEKDIADPESALLKYKTTIKQLRDTNREIITKQSRQVNVLKEHIDNLKACVDLREISRQKLEYAQIKLRAEIVKVQKQVTECEQKSEMKTLHHNEEVHSLQKIVERLVSGESRENVLSGGPVLQNPPLTIPPALRENSLAANLLALFEKSPHLRPQPPLKQPIPRAPPAKEPVNEGNSENREGDIRTSHEREIRGVMELREMRESAENPRVENGENREIRENRESRDNLREVHEIRRPVENRGNGQLRGYTEIHESELRNDDDEHDRKRQKN